MYAGLGVISAYIREKGIKSHVQQIMSVFMDDLGKIKGKRLFHGVQRVLLCPYPTAFKKNIISSNKIVFCFDEMFEFHIANLKN